MKATGSFIVALSTHFPVRLGPAAAKAGVAEAETEEERHHARIVGGGPGETPAAREVVGDEEGGDAGGDAVAPLRRQGGQTEDLGRRAERHRETRARRPSLEL